MSTLKFTEIYRNFSQPGSRVGHFRSASRQLLSRRVAVNSVSADTGHAGFKVHAVLIYDVTRFQFVSTGRRCSAKTKRAQFKSVAMAHKVTPAASR